ncbi:hypothetical protein RUM44_000393 [Polyplax serrata]|uniref:FAD-binding FR-type domain-containing protein n=1 Tax=Polyplax serrata TaxID=468196 RepID=A0ABR1B5F5_POLSC
MTLLDTSSPDQKRHFKIPNLPDEYLEIEFLNDNDGEIMEIQQSCPFAISTVTPECIINARRLTHGDDIKETYSVELSNKFSAYKPGDTIGILTETRQQDVNVLFSHLGIKSLAERKIKVLKKLNSKKNNHLDFPYIDKVTTLNAIFKSCIDIYSSPRKLLIRVLSHYTKDENEKMKLEKLCSAEGSELYTATILEKKMTFLDFILMFKTCCPPIPRLLENLPKLLPRPYSIASSPLASENKIKLIFSITKMPNTTLCEGLCTGMLKSIISKGNIEESSLKFFFRKSNGFNLPEDNVPLILIGPGTGIAPFLGFLEHRKLQEIYSTIWLFYGCRYRARDFLFEEELNEFLNSGILTRLIVAFSRECDANAKYVQDNLKRYGKEITDLIFNENAVIYVCGDAKRMGKDIQNTFVELFEHHQGVTNKAAIDIVKQLQKDKRYLQDLWM